MDVRLASAHLVFGFLLSSTGLLLAACVGQIGDPPGGGAGEPGSFAPPDDAVADAWVTGARQLTVAQYRATVASLLGFEPGEELLSRLPADLPNPDNLNPFRNDYTAQSASAALVQAADGVAFELADRALGPAASAEQRERIVGCVPLGPDDAMCFRSFVERFGRLAFRRPLTSDEVEPYLALQAFSIDDTHQTPDFYAGARLVLAAMLQDPRFLYLLEIGAPVDETDRVRLTPYEVATRLSFMLLDTAPEAALLDAAADGELDDAEGRRAHAERMLDDPRAAQHLQSFHATWLGYDELPHDPALAERMQTETRALIDRVVIDERASWNELLRSETTYVDAVLAEHYGLPAPSTDGFGWVDYASPGRRGLLSHGAILSNGTKWNDTSVVQRGLFVRERLLCQSIPPPPPDVNVDDAPERTDESPCKTDQSALRMNGACETCHSALDPIGFGLDQYDGAGRFRTHEPEYPECEIDGQGRIAGIGSFEGPAGLAELLDGNETLDRCVVAQVYRLASGHQEEPTEGVLLDELARRYLESDRRLDRLLVEIAASESFVHRRPARGEP